MLKQEEILLLVYSRLVSLHIFNGQRAHSACLGIARAWPGAFFFSLSLIQSLPIFILKKIFFFSFQKFFLLCMRGVVACADVQSVTLLPSRQCTAIVCLLLEMKKF